MRHYRSKAIAIAFVLGLVLIVSCVQGISVFAIGGKVLDVQTDGVFTVQPINPKIDIRKYTNGVDADVPAGPLVAVGSTVTWTYEISNTGNVTLTNIIVTDNRNNVTPVYISGDTNGDGDLDLTEIWLYRATGIAVAGQYSNTGTVRGTPAFGPTVTASNPSHYFGTTQPPAFIGDRVWFDHNQNGVQDVGENGISGVTVELYRQDSPSAEGAEQATLVATDTTGIDGLYGFAGLPPGAYYVQFTAPQTFNFTRHDMTGDDRDSDALVPSLAASLSAPDEDDLALGEPLTYTLFYTNGDLDLPAVNLTISKTVPVGTSFIITGSSAGWNCTTRNAGGVCTLSIPSLAANSSGSITFVVLLDEDDDDVPPVLRLFASLTYSRIARTDVIILEAGTINPDVDAGLIRTERNVQTISPTGPTNLPTTEQPDEDKFIFLPTVQTID